VRVRNDSFTGRLWHIPEATDHDPIADTPYPDFVTKLLRRRGVQSADEARTYLFDTPYELPDAMLLPSIETALERIEQAVRDDETIAIYGDFDVDGVTSSTILTEAIRAIGGRVSPYIPDRFTEGYGLNRPALQTLHDRGVSLVITADCGITSIPEVTFAQEIGEDVIILDHHSVPDETPDAYATVNPKMPESAYPFDEMSTGGLAYRVAHLLADRAGLSVDADKWLDLAALSTVADVVPLVADNRWIVAEGLRAIRETPRAGLQALLDVSGLWDQELDTDSIAFGLAPRINAAGRLEHALLAVELLMETEPDRAKERAQELDRLNLKRRQLTLEAMERGEEQLALEPPDFPITFIGDPEIPAGIVGLVAGRMAESRHRPAIVYEEGPEFCRASCRSILEFDIAAALRSCDDLLVKHGGHAMAAGFTVRHENLAALRQRLASEAESKLATITLQPRIEVDAQVPLARVSASQVSWLQRLGPFGAGNPAPTFVSTSVQVAEARRVGADKSHLRLRLRDGDRVWAGIGFRLGHAAVETGARVDVVWSLKRNGDYGGVELEVKDLAPATSS
jgi:single-stranded-DNA-specific exonuclease